MAYVRRRTTQAGMVSTPLVEAYRDDQGRPRQRVLANLHGEPDTFHALAKLAAQRESLRQTREWLAKQVAQANQWYAESVQAVLTGEASHLMRKRGDALPRPMPPWRRSRERA